MRLLLVAEQTALLRKVTSQYNPTLEPLKTKDGRVNITPVLTVTPPQQPQPALRPAQIVSYGSYNGPYSTTTTTTVSLSVSCSFEPAEPTMLLCKLFVSDRRCGQTKDYKPPQTKEGEARVILQPGSNYVTSWTLPSGHPFDMVTILFRVYDIVDGHPASGLIQRLNRARLEGSSSCDVKLVVDGVELDAHRAVLTERSPVLNRMLTTGFKEAREGHVEVVDFPRAAIEKFLEYLYTDRVEDCGGCEVELLQLADKYEVPELTDYCVLRLWTCSPPRALQVLNATGVSDIVSSQLRRRLTAIVVDNLTDLDGTAEWADFMETHPALVDIMLGSAAWSGGSSCPMWSQDHLAGHSGGVLRNKVVE